MIGSPAIILITDIPGAGKTTVAAALDDIVMGPWLDIHREAFAGLPWRLVVLVPDIDAVKARNAGRDKDIFDTWGYLDTALRAAMQGLGVWIDSTAQTVDETVDEILFRLGSAYPEESKDQTPAAGED